MAIEAARPAGLGRIRAHVLGILRPWLYGFLEHGWGGRLFLITGAVGIAGSALTTLAMIGRVLAGDAAYVSAPVPLILLMFGLIVLQWKVLSGVARFRPWARIVALVGSAGGVATGLLLLQAGGGVRMTIVALGQAALAAQFFVYFLRNGERFRS